MADNLNKQYIQKMLNMATYSNEVVLVSIDNTIALSRRNAPALVSLFSDEYFAQIYRHLEAKKSSHNLHLEDLKVLLKELHNRFKSNETTELTEDEKEYENLLINAISEIASLIDTLDIKLKMLFQHTGVKYENNN